MLFDLKNIPDDALSDSSALLDAVQAILPGVIQARRHLHHHPELSGEESKTANYLANTLTRHHISVKRNIGGHGLLATIKAPGATKWVALRADMDALPITDGKQCDYASAADGISHSCGHDAHSAMLLGAAIILQHFRKHLPFHVAAIFQPAEETTEGAAAMLQDGLFDAFAPERIHALHVYPYLPSGSIGMRNGAMCAAADMFEVEITGRGGHAARPHECTDVILIASHIIQALNHIISRRVDPLLPAVLTIGHIQGGVVANVMPDKVRFSGTVRTLNPEVHNEVRLRMDRIIRQTAEAWGAIASFTFRQSTPVLHNDAEIIRLARKQFATWAPDTRLIDIEQPSMGGEDFAHYLEHSPGCLLRLGTAHDPSTRYPLHHPCFDIDETAMGTGIAALVSLCLEYDSR